MDNKHQLDTYRVVNLLPFVSMPDRISVVRLRTALRFRPPNLALAKAGIFIHNGDEVWSFTPLPTITAALDVMLDKDLGRSRPRAEIEADPTASKVLSWLLRKHFERYLGRFSAQGIFVEGDINGSRAYFHGQGGKARSVTYVSRSAGETTRNVVVQRWGGRRPWFKNEGLGYQVMMLGAVWGVAIEPFYIFAGADACKPLPYAAQIERTNRWNGRDARTGQSHLTFWEDFLTAGAPLVDLRQDGVDNLFLGRSLLQLSSQPAAAT